MVLEKGLPGGLALAIGDWLNAVLLQDVAYGRIRRVCPRLAKASWMRS
jgi:hypothetical protein